jgi:hypothetical protein
MRNPRPSVLMIAFVVGVSGTDLPPASASNDLRVDSREYKLPNYAPRHSIAPRPCSWRWRVCPGPMPTPLQKRPSSTSTGIFVHNMLFLDTL